MTARWSFSYRVIEDLPPLAWLARVGDASVEIDCGTSVRREPQGFFEGTWTGPAGLAALPESTTPFGSGMVAQGDDLLIVPPGHTLAGVFALRADGRMLVSNSLLGLLAAADLAPRPDVDYVTEFFRLADGIDNTPIELPTTGAPVELHFYENLLVHGPSGLEKVAKPREAPFASYADYVGRLEAALAQAFANAPAYRPVVALSSGYDSTAVAVLAARHGCGTALTFTRSRPPLTTTDNDDSGEATANRLGLQVERFDWRAYLQRDDLPEAEFVATGFTGEDVVLVAMEPSLRRTMLLTGGVGSAVWRRGREERSDLMRGDLSGCSLTEFRLRTDFIDLTLPIFGMSEIASLQRIAQSVEMTPWSVGGYYDKPIARRIAEEGGIPRGTFANDKRAVSALLHQVGAAAFAPASRVSIREFAAAEGSRIDLSPRRRLSRFDRALIRVADRLRADRLAAPLKERMREIVRHDRATGSILFRWGVAHAIGRYAALRPSRVATTTGPRP